MKFQRRQIKSFAKPYLQKLKSREDFLSPRLFPRQKTKNNPERVFLIQALRYIKLVLKFPCYVIKTTGTYHAKAGRWLSDPLRETGLPDLLIILKGFSVFCELKDGDNRPTLNQAKRLSENVNGEGFSLVCYSLEDIEKGINLIKAYLKKKIWVY